MDFPIIVPEKKGKKNPFKTSHFLLVSVFLIVAERSTHFRKFKNQSFLLVSVFYFFLFVVVVESILF